MSDFYREESDCGCQSPVNAFGDGALPNQQTLWGKNAWEIRQFDHETPYGTRDRIAVVNDDTGVTDYPVIYDDGTLGWDRPESIPKYVQEVTQKVMAKGEFGAAPTGNFTSDCDCLPPKGNFGAECHEINDDELDFVGLVQESQRKPGVLYVIFPGVDEKRLIAEFFASVRESHDHNSKIKLQGASPLGKCLDGEQLWVIHFTPNRAWRTERLLLPPRFSETSRDISDGTPGVPDHLKDDAVFRGGDNQDNNSRGATMPNSKPGIFKTLFGGVFAGKPKQSKASTFEKPDGSERELFVPWEKIDGNDVLVGMWTAFSSSDLKKKAGNLAAAIATMNPLGAAAATDALDKEIEKVENAAAKVAARMVEKLGYSVEGLEDVTPIMVSMAGASALGIPAVTAYEFAGYYPILVYLQVDRTLDEIEEDEAAEVESIGPKGSRRGSGLSKSGFQRGGGGKGVMSVTQPSRSAGPTPVDDSIVDRLAELADARAAQAEAASIEAQETGDEEKLMEMIEAMIEAEVAEAAAQAGAEAGAQAEAALEAQGVIPQDNFQCPRPGERPERPYNMSSEKWQRYRHWLIENCAPVQQGRGGQGGGGRGGQGGGQGQMGPGPGQGGGGGGQGYDDDYWPDTGDYFDESYWPSV